MRRMLLSLAIVLSALADAASLRAGVYNLDPPRSDYRSEFLEATQPNVNSVRSRLGDLRAIDERTPKPRGVSLRDGYLRQTTELEIRERRGVLSPEDRINLGACSIRLGRLTRARAVLEEAQRVVSADCPCYFLILLNLASTYQDDAELLPRAISLQTRALKSWPNVWVGWKTLESNWYRRAETFALRLMNLRQLEASGARDGRMASYETVDALFAGVRFVGPAGRYEAGAIDFDMRNKMPLDALSLVIQLMLWRPHDDRLFWLYGELLNANGAVESAFTVLKELVDARNGGQAELRAHRIVLRNAQDSFKAVQEFAQKPADWEQLLWAVAPRGSLLTPGLGDAANETAWLAALHLSSRPAPLEALTQPRSPAPTTSRALPDWRHITVSFVTGVIVAVLGALQWQQWRSRKDKR